jgi:hypothetical protein
MSTGGEFSPSELNAYVHGVPADEELARNQLSDLFQGYSNAQDRRDERMSDDYMGQILLIFEAFPALKEEWR